MKLAISNIAWGQDQEDQLFPHFRAQNITGIEVAPTKIWPAWEGANERSAVSYAQNLLSQGFKIPSLQAVLFGKPDLQVFNVETHPAFFEHIKLVADIAAGFDARVFVWGAPRNRSRGQLSVSEAYEIAAGFFTKAADICASRNICIGMEHNPVGYGCDFVTNVADARYIVDQVSHKAFQLHIDTGGIHMCGGVTSNVIEQAGKFAHFQASEPDLTPLAGGVVDHAAAGRVLQKMQYSGWVSIEMKQPKDPQEVIRSVEHAARAYGAIKAI